MEKDHSKNMITQNIEALENSEHFNEVIKKFGNVGVTVEDLKAFAIRMSLAFQNHTDELKKISSSAETATLLVKKIGIVTENNSFPTNGVNPFYRQHQNKRKWK
ncbi:hypothetical protein [Chryseobacterium oncorhynchi]|uniref:Uncharacterized protein n=1 Tax=Chryseobacterium oncorhynchi TaxID=741074 RepID=A0A316WLJ0_9FLAO|nr:hypothetical protein [Chryseobacterium oncorhynchi]PWN62291.1 hypothetical protein C1638_017515 [Chryseobacterium oncorhynchi]